ncbi:hypothetical protein DIURU_004345 [Diutina rugosa]|uniref:Bul1 N-terminal domain-containing protein n=1 Tax=Diutina rugosa TaxID=5481 RepID=A0A642UHT1_DIURU|nr:uncharacterized protein DIURU_004345 [Diutina rugosa]KAA8899323.1 hypothetical protein DIURU_004345 [Diutina rugosa]
MAPPASTMEPTPPLTPHTPQPLASPTEECSILPSYHMYTHIVTGEPCRHRSHRLPPDYNSEDESDDSPAMSRASSPAVVPARAPMAALHPRQDVVAEATALGDSKLLDRLLKLEDRNVDGLDIAVHFTRESCKLGVPSTEIAQRDKYTEGDTLQGYITIDNNTDTTIMFDSFLILLEGVYTSHSTGFKRQFLQMLDFGASYNPARINRLVGDNDYPYRLLDTYIDPVDGRQAGFSFGGQVERRVNARGRYKRFFAFTLPPGILDCECEENIPEHLQLPPTMSNELASISYAITTRIIGWNHNATSDDNQWYIFKQHAHPITVEPQRNSYHNALERLDLSERMYYNFIHRIEEELQQRTLHEKGERHGLPTTIKSTALVEETHTFGPTSRGALVVSLKRSVPTIWLSAKKIGLSLSLSLEYTSDDISKAPKIKQSLVTIQEIDYATDQSLPFSLGVFLFNNPVTATSHDADTLDYAIESTRKLAGLLRNVAIDEQVRLNADVVNHVKAMCKLRWKSTTHVMKTFNKGSTISKRANKVPWQKIGPNTVGKQVTIDIDHRHFTSENLTPCWNLCMTGKFHILKITFVLGSGQKVNLKLPLHLKA